ncbi:hypothetical protein HAX54_036841, partial [Datura stramonium]|nr:hypothetical protein [Datura stramonium]
MGGFNGGKLGRWKIVNGFWESRDIVGQIGQWVGQDFKINLRTSTCAKMAPPVSTDKMPVQAQ